MIEYPNKFSEFDLQATIFRRLREKKIDARGEVSTKTVYYMDSDGRRKKGRCRFDLVVFENKKPICIIETKRHKGSRDRKMTKQLRKYAVFSMPIIVFSNINKTAQVVKLVELLIEQSRETKPSFVLFEFR